MNQNDPNFNNAFSNPDPTDDYIAEEIYPKTPRVSRKWKISLIALGVFLLIFVVTPGFVYLRASNTSPNIPTEDFEPMSQFELDREIDSSSLWLEDNSLVERTLRQSLINRYLYNYIQANVNPMYDPNSQCELAQCEYLYHELHETGDLLIGVKGIWVEFDEDQFYINAAIDYNDLISISTVARFEVEINFNIDRINLDIVDFKLDNYNVPNFVLNQIKTSLSENLELELPPAYERYLDVDLAELNATMRQADLRHVLDSGNARIEAIDVVDGGIIFIIRYLN